MSALLGDALRRAFANGERIRFIQIGGNDGILGDPLYQYHVDRTFDFEWGHIFEPIPEYFELLVANMRPFPYITCHNLAVDDSPVPGHREFSYLSRADVEMHGLPESSKALGSFSRERNALSGIGYSEAKFNKIKPYIRTTEVETVPVRDVVERYRDANFLLTDCEGYDIEIIRAAFSGSSFRPKVVQFEDLGQSRDMVQSTLGQLQSIGYRISRFSRDVVCELE